jgi:hypothetical protein
MVRGLTWLRVARAVINCLEGVTAGLPRQYSLKRFMQSPFVTVTYVFRPVSVNAVVSIEEEDVFRDCDVLVENDLDVEVQVEMVVKVDAWLPVDSRTLC